MNEIDDAYKEQGESVDQAFLDEAKKNGRDIAIKNYLKNLSSAKEKYYREYKKYLKKGLLNKKKKKKKKKKEFKRFKIEHFDFKIGLKDRLKLKFNILKFKTNIFLNRIFYKFVPEFLIYKYYKVSKNISRSNEEFRELFENVYSNVVDYFVKVGLKVGKIFKKVYAEILRFWKIVISKIIFWRKASDEKEGKVDGDGVKKDGDGVKK